MALSLEIVKDELAAPEPSDFHLPLNFIVNLELLQTKKLKKTEDIS